MKNSEFRIVDGDNHHLCQGQYDEFIETNFPCPMSKRGSMKNEQLRMKNWKHRVEYSLINDQLMLYTIEQQKQIKALKAQLEKQSRMNNE